MAQIHPLTDRELLDLLYAQGIRPVAGGDGAEEEAARQEAAKRADRVKEAVDLMPVGERRAKARMRLGREGADVPPVPEEVTYPGGDAIPSGKARIRSARRVDPAAD